MSKLILDLGDAYWKSDDHALDPYLRWAELTDFRNLGRGGLDGASHLSFIVERSNKVNGWDAFRKLSGVSVPSAYDEHLPSAARKVSFFATARIEIADDVNKRVLALLTHRGATRVQLGYPRGKDKTLVGLPQPMPRGKLKAQVVLGIIDDGCPFAHPDMRDDADNTRLALLWQQSVLDEPESPWTEVEGFDYGRALNAKGMALFMKEYRDGADVDELRCYRAAFASDEPLPAPHEHISYPKPSRELLSRESHGASVMTVAGGRLSNLHGRRPRYEAGNDLYGRPGDPASKCPLIFVDLPREQVEISSGRWISINALDGLRFILREARERFERHDGEPLPVVVNLSSGSTAGSHVGQAMLERAMDELLSADPHLAITLAAGNSRESESHAQFKVPKGGSASLGLFVPPMKRFDTVVEFWLPAKQDLSGLVVSALSPGGEELTVWTDHREDILGTNPQDRSAALLFYPHVVQATDRTMVLLVVSGTTTGAGRQAVSLPGPWVVTVYNEGKKDTTVQAWIERDEVVFGMRRDQSARLFDVDSGASRKSSSVRQVNTMSNIATGERVFAVGAYRGLKSEGPVARYSGAPAQDWLAQKPKRYLPFAAKADAGLVHAGVRAPGNRGNVTRRLNGTSVAAPQAARYVANEMAGGHTRADVEGALPKRPAKLPSLPEPDPSDGRRRL